jgi:phage terminase large subunit
MTVITVPYSPNKKQSIFHSSAEQEVVYGGAKGGGKSCALMMEALAYGLEYAGARLYLFRETFDDLEANLINEMKEKWPKELYSYNESKHIATLLNGTRVFFRYIRNKQDADRYQGRSMDFVGVDELTKYDYDWIRILLSCLRSPKGFPPLFRGTCNPGGRGHGWVKERYIEATGYGEKVIDDPDTENKMKFIPAQVYDNDVLMANDPAYVKRLENLPEDEKKAFLYGDWDIFAGQYFTSFRRDKHVVEPFNIPTYWRRYRSIDWGFNDHCAIYWHAADTDGREYTYRELYINETLATEVAKQIIEKSVMIDEDGNEVPEKIEYTVASPDMWQKRGHQVVGKNGEMIGKSIADYFLDEGVPLIKADNSRVVGWTVMKEKMADLPDGKPRWQIFSTCSNLTRTIPLMIRDDKNVEDIADGLEDHPCESVRYYHMSRPRPSKTPEKPHNVIQQHKQTLIKKLNRNRKRFL